jgi:hypothetical protein
VTADGYLVWPGDAVWVKHWWGWEQHTVGQCWPRKIAYTCVDREGYVGSRITKRVYYIKPLRLSWGGCVPRTLSACETHIIEHPSYVAAPVTFDCTPRIK